MGFFKAHGTGLNGHPSRDFRHGCQQRQVAPLVSHRLVRDADGPAPDQLGSLVIVGREVQIGEEKLFRLEKFSLRRLGFLNLDDHLRHFEDLFSSRENRCSGFFILPVRVADSGSG